MIYKLQHRHDGNKTNSHVSQVGHTLKDHKAKAAIAARVFRLANGLLGDVSPVGQGISELRIHYGPGYRVYFKQNGNEIIILLC